MPRRDSFQLCKALRQDEKLRTIPIILLAVQKDEESRMEGLRQGADAYLGKPFRPAELRQRAENLIDVRRLLTSGVTFGKGDAEIETSPRCLRRAGRSSRG
jgi:DNA-binding response OmpR family regulator